MFFKCFSGKLGILFFARLRFFLTGAAGSSVEIGSAAFFFLRRFLGAALLSAALLSALPPLLFFQDALARFSDSLKLVLPAACTFFTC